jgi:hypothetical protein
MTTQQAASALAVLGMIILSPLAATADDGIDRVTIRPLPGRGRPVAGRTDGAGTIHLLYDAEGGPKYARSTDDGVTFGAAVPVVNRGSQTAGLEYSAWDMAIGKAGRVHVAMGTNAWKLKLPEEEWGVPFFIDLVNSKTRSKRDHRPTIGLARAFARRRF